MLALAVAATPILAVAMPWLYLRIRFFRRKLTVLTLASTHAGQELLAMRALANRPLAKLTAVDPDPIGAWRRDHRLMAVGGPVAMTGFVIGRMILIIRSHMEHPSMTAASSISTGRAFR